MITTSATSQNVDDGDDDGCFLHYTKQKSCAKNDGDDDDDGCFLQYTKKK